MCRRRRWRFGGWRRWCLRSCTEPGCSPAQAAQPVSITPQRLAGTAVICYHNPIGAPCTPGTVCRCRGIFADTAFHVATEKGSKAISQRCMTGAKLLWGGALSGPSRGQRDDMFLHRQLTQGSDMTLSEQRGVKGRSYAAHRLHVKLKGSELAHAACVGGLHCGGSIGPKLALQHGVVPAQGSVKTCCQRSPRPAKVGKGCQQGCSQGCSPGWGRRYWTSERTHSRSGCD